MGVQRSLLIDIKTPSEYVGYDELTNVQGTLNDIIVDETLVDHVDSGQAEMIFSKTPFYAEMGGQVADRGVILDDAGEMVAKVTDVQNAPNKQHLHAVEVLKPMRKD
ncbi:alanine--tRNA ligase-related protein, partial [Klebsiella pneumoniae]|nr:alanine--tRNA ligase-related protein [Klebsiella pneumoniae]